MDKKPLQLSPITPGFEEQIQAEHSTAPYTQQSEVDSQATPPVATPSPQSITEPLSVDYVNPSYGKASAQRATPYSERLQKDSPGTGISGSLISVFILALAIVAVNGYQLFVILSVMSKAGNLTPIYGFLAVVSGLGVLIGIGLLIRNNLARLAMIWLQAISLVLTLPGLLTKPGSAFGSIVFYSIVIALLSSEKVKSAFNS